jgi:polysaccharide pyruvyl transferase WcaK-like protein
MCKIFILYHGFGNIGDFAIFKGTLKILHQIIPNAEFMVIDSKPLPNRSYDFKIRWLPTRYLFGDCVLKRILTSLKSVLQIRPRVSTGGVSMKIGDDNSILWHKGGSGYDGYHGTMPLLLSAISTLALAKNFNSKILGGLSMGFYRNNLEKIIIKHFSEAWDCILLREPFSKYYLTKAGINKNIFLLHDFAFCVEERYSNNTQKIIEKLEAYNDKPRLAISIRDYYYDYTTTLYNSYLRFIGNLLKTLAKDFYVFIIPMSFSGYRENDVRFIKVLRALRIIPRDVMPLYDVITLDPEELLPLLKSFDVGLSIRTHFGILSSIAGLPVFQLFYEHKGVGIFKFSLNSLLPTMDLFKVIHNPSNHLQLICKLISKMSDERSGTSKELQKLITNNRMHNLKVVKRVLEPYVAP